MEIEAGCVSDLLAMVRRKQVWVLIKHFLGVFLGKGLAIKGYNDLENHSLFTTFSHTVCENKV